MTSHPPGWYSDPDTPGQVRWWDGMAWTTSVGPDGAPPAHPLGSVRESPAKRRIRWWGWALIAVGVVFAIAAPPIALPLAIVALITGIVGWARGGRTWLRLRSRKSAMALTAIAAAALLLAGGSSAVAGAARAPQAEASAFSAQNTSQNEQRTAEPRPSATPTPKPSPTPTATPEVREEVVTEAVVFAEVTVDDPNLASGQTRITTEGVPGERTITYRVTTLDGQEIDRVIVSDAITRAPVDRVTANGTYVAPPPAAPAPVAGSAGGGCDANYAEACVPVSSDVDCAGGSGNGPAYFDGVARIVGSDIYDLDRDNDGYACEPN
ncbi:G5 domain-containing protein [Microbacterium stercoris]|uniref:G5 domain-containing protein n=1 Tax=Microbacterium stercoris TaxID=2820289 RepID=A0A939QG34_9MICO|nr:G5 domain-containing protein [Microbacterium stercoris]MBO3662272.1 G5 domain-containing protein [Microbacterium stercoris]